MNTTKLYHNENTAIYTELSQFEDELQRLAASIQQYNPDPEIASEIVLTVDKMNSELEKIELLHEMRSNQIVKQNTENDQLNDNLRSILSTLSDCRQELDRLPKLSSTEVSKLEDLEKVVEEPDLDTTKQLLAYAMKLSKFSRIPRTFDGFLLPNNFVWPGDDNMRRGMLAMASMMPEKVVEAENGGAEDTKEEEKEEEEVNKEDQSDEEMEDEPASTRRRSDVNESEVMAGLDLFDEDEE
ncbi:DEKNAAC102197 [Brettanomyces naardenensis]|uniref:Mediator of RNA polymerase II transcription subunit 4 n=1 Tax=Brettanomyces naardenensis TaxID=13370 RepID=A0A448YK25_BRENA|nr:DEKNAAC102197 [Brettanomyces naardenensis]